MTPVKRYLTGSTFLYRDPVTIGTAIGSALGIGSATLGATVLGVSVAGAIGYVATTLVTSWVLSALLPKPDLGSLNSRGLLVNSKDPISAHDAVYGKIRKGGVITYLEVTNSPSTTNGYLHQIITLAGHEVNAVGDIYINDEVVTLDANGFVTSSPWNSKIRVKKYTGSQTTADPNGILAESSVIDNTFVGRGIAYLYVRFEYDPEVFSNGVPLITAVVEGKKVFDPRTSTTAYSNNAALCIRDYLTSSYGLSDTFIDDTAFSIAANACDEFVSLSGGGSERRYTLNGVVPLNTSHGDVLQRMMTSCAGTLFWGGGNWKLVAGDYIPPTKTLTLDDLRSPISFQTRTNLRDQFNIVQGTFNDADQRWITVDYPSTKQRGEGLAFITEDNGQESPIDFALPFTTSSATAQRLSKLTLFRGREQMTITADFGLNAFDIEVGEIVALTLSRYGWTNKEFEVQGWNFKIDPEAGDIRIGLVLRETSSAAFDWNAEEDAIIGNNTNLTPANLALWNAPPVSISTQLSSSVVITDKIDDLAVERVKVARGAITNSLLTFTSMSFSQNTSGTYGATSLPPTDLTAAGYFVIGSQSYTVPSDAPDQLWMRVRPTWTLFYALLATPPAANHENGWWHHINVTNQLGSVVTSNYYAVVQQFQSNGYVVFTPNHKTDGETLPVLKLSEDYFAGDVLTFTHRFYRYRSNTAYGVGAAVSDVSLRVDEVYR